MPLFLFLLIALVLLEALPFPLAGRLRLVGLILLDLVVDLVEELKSLLVAVTHLNI